VFRRYHEPDAWRLRCPCWWCYVVPVLVFGVAAAWEILASRSGGADSDFAVTCHCYLTGVGATCSSSFCWPQGWAGGRGSRLRSALSLPYPGIGFVIAFGHAFSWPASLFRCAAAGQVSEEEASLALGASGWTLFVCTSFP